MKQVLIIPGNTDLNRGDQALVWESIRLVEDVYGKENVSCFLMTDLYGRDAYLQNRQTKKLGYRFINTLLKHPGRKFQNKVEDSKGYSKITLAKWGWQAFWDFFHTRLLLSQSKFLRSIGESFLTLNEKETLNVIKTIDVVFVKGGGFIHSYGGITDPYFIYFLTFHLRLAEAYGKKVVMLPNSVGPLKNSIARKIAIKALKKCSLVTVRENLSKSFLKTLGIEASCYPDLGFFLQPSEYEMETYLKQHGIPKNQKKIVLTLRPYRFTGYDHPNELFEKYISSFVEFVQYLVAEGYHITFMAHTLGPSSHENDSIAIRNVLEALPNYIHKEISYIEDSELNCRDIEKLYSYYDYMIGTRFHSVIFSLNVNVPSIAIAYGGNKGRGIMEFLDNGEFSIDMDKVTDSILISTFENLKANRENYLANLSEKLSLIKDERERLVEAIRNI